MSNIAIQGAATGTGVFTLASPATNTDRTLTLPDEAGTVLTRAAGSPDNSVVVDASGNVGIGTSLPSNTLEVKSSTNDNGIRLSNSAGSYYHLVRSNGDGLLFDADAGNTGGSGADIRFQIKGGEKARITSGGDLLVGTTSTISSHKVRFLQTAAAPCLALQVTGSDYQNMVTFYNSGGTVKGSISSPSGSSVAYNTSSDYRLKENIAPMVGALAKVQQLKPCTYTWKDSGQAWEGFIAHEVAEVVPNAVAGEKDAVDAEGNPQYQGIDTSFLVATLTAAIQELKAINDAQAQTIESLTARVVALEGQP